MRGSRPSRQLAPRSARPKARLRTRRGLLWLALLVIGLGASPPVAAQTGGPLPGPPPGEATLRGRVVHADTGEPVEGAQVALYALTADGVPGVGRTESNAEGRFAFEGISNDPGTSYLVGARYAGIPHPGGRLAFPAGQTEAEVEIRVNPVTDDPSRVGIEWMRFELDRIGGALRVTQTLRVGNDGPRTYAKPDATATDPAGVVVPLPEGVGELAMPLGVMPEGMRRDGQTLHYYGPVHPGGGELSWSYELAGDEGGALTFAPPVPRRVGRLEVLLGEGLEVSATSGLVPGEDTTLDGAPYRTLRADAERPFSVAVSLPPARIDPDAIAIEEVRLVLHADDAAVQVSETHVIQVEGEQAVRAAGPEAPLLRVPLPVANTRLRFGTSDPGLRVEPDGTDAVRVMGTAPPGESMVELAYRVPVEGDTVDFSRRFDRHTSLLSIFMADTGRLLVESDRLHRRRPARTSDLTYLHLEAFEIEAGETVALRVSTLPPRGGLGRPATWAALGVLSLAALYLLLAPLRDALAASRVEADPDADETPERREREALYASIRDLDHDFETGKIAEEDHAVLRDDLRARALSLLRAERAERAARAAREAGRVAGDEPAAPAGAKAHAGAPVCPSCQAVAAPDHRFCARCGTPLGDASGPALGADAREGTGP